LLPEKKPAVPTEQKGFPEPVWTLWKNEKYEYLPPTEDRIMILCSFIP
jgi:hypothetical protein